MYDFIELCWPDYYYCCKGSIICTRSLMAHDQLFPFSLCEVIPPASHPPCAKRQTDKTGELAFSGPCLGSFHWARLLFLGEWSQAHLGGLGDACVFRTQPNEKMLFFFFSKQSWLKNQHCYRNTVWVKYFKNWACYVIAFQKPEKINFYLN